MALGGGFARSLAHLGVLKVLEEHQIPIHAIAGTSAGSAIGGAYASGTSVEQLIEWAGSVRFKDFARWTLSRMGLASNERMEQFLRRLFRATTFEELRLPLAVVATNLMTGEPVVFRSGDLIEPVRASCAYPGLFQPVQVNGRTLIDGGLACPVPVAALLQMGATHIIAVQPLADAKSSRPPQNLFQLVAQCFSLLEKRGDDGWRRAARAIIEPDVAGYAWDDFEQASQLIAAGEAAARQRIGRIRSWLRPQAASDLASFKLRDPRFWRPNPS